MSIRAGKMRIVVSGSFTARHCCLEGFPHPHTWHVTAWFDAPYRADATVYRGMVDNILAHWDGTDLPEGRDWNEDIAAGLSVLAKCSEIRVWREADRLGVHWVR